jgi:hypothetical protein
MTHEKRTNGATTRKSDDELRAEVVAEFEARYTANRPKKGDERDRALGVAAELRAELDRCVHAIRADDDDAQEAAERVRRMRRALHRAQTEEHLAPIRLVPVFRGLRFYHKGTRRPVDAVAFGVARDMCGSDLDGWTDEQIAEVVSARVFKDAMAKALSEHGHAMTAKRVEQLMTGRKRRT